MDLLERIFAFHWFNEDKLAESFRQLNRRAFEIAEDAKIISEQQARNLKEHTISTTEIETTRRALEEAAQLLYQTEARMKRQYESQSLQGELMDDWQAKVQDFVQKIGTQLTGALSGGSFLAADYEVMAKLIEHTNLSKVVEAMNPETVNALRDLLNEETGQ